MHAGGAFVLATTIGSSLPSTRPSSCPLPSQADVPSAKSETRKKLGPRHCKKSGVQPFSKRSAGLPYALIPFTYISFLKISFITAFHFVLHLDKLCHEY